MGELPHYTLRVSTSFFLMSEKKRFLGEVVHKIKVDSKSEVHLLLKPPPLLRFASQTKAKRRGLTVPSGSPNRI